MMKKLVFLILVSLGLYGCDTTTTIDDLYTSVKEVSETLELSSGNADPTVGNFNNNNNKTKEENSLAFAQWQCYEHWSSSGYTPNPELVMTVGYFPDILDYLDEELGNAWRQDNIKPARVEIKTTSQTMLSYYKPEGMDNLFGWGGDDHQRFTLKITPSGTAYFFDFEGSGGKSIPPDYTLNCQSGFPETVYLTKSDLEEFFQVWRNTL